MNENTYSTIDLNARRNAQMGIINMSKITTMEERIKRINELYHKSQQAGLTEEEKKEQAELRAEYVANVRANLRGQLNNITIQNPDGTTENLGEKFGETKGH